MLGSTRIWAQFPCGWLIVLRYETKRSDTKQVYDTRCSQAVPHPSTILARRCLTSVIGRERVYSSWYGRRQRLTQIGAGSFCIESPSDATSLQRDTGVSDSSYAIPHRYACVCIWRQICLRLYLTSHTRDMRVTCVSQRRITGNAWEMTETTKHCRAYNFL